MSVYLLGAMLIFNTDYWQQFLCHCLRSRNLVTCNGKFNL